MSKKVVSWLRKFLRARPHRNHSRRARLRFEELEARNLLSATTFHLEFGPAGAAVASGYTLVTPVGYNASQGYGWLNPSTVQAAAAGTGNPLHNNFAASHSNDFEVALPNGSYNVTVTLGDSSSAHGPMTISAEGSKVYYSLSTSANQFVTLSFVVPSIQGLFDLGLTAAGEGSTFAINSLVITPVTSTTTPTATAGANQTGYVGTALSFIGTAKNGTGPETYLWTFGDGTSSTGYLNTNHAYSSPGTYTVTLKVTDALGDVATSTSQVTIKSSTPTAKISGAPATSPAGTAITLTGSATDLNPAETAAGFTYAWTVTSSGTTVSTGTGSTFKFTPATGGTYVVTLTASTLDGYKSAPVTSSISVSNSLPTAKIAGAPTSIAEETAITLTGSATGGSGTGYTYAWTVTDSGKTFATGTGTTFKFTPNDVGQYVVSLVATDSKGAKSAAVTTTVSATEVVPTVSITGAPASGAIGTAIALGSTVTDVSPIAAAAGYTYSWSVTKNGAAFASGTSSSFSFTPNAAATYVVTLSATDKNHGTGTSQKTIVVSTNVPTAKISGAPTSIAEEKAIALTGSATGGSGTGYTYAWTVTNNGKTFATGTGAAFSFTPNDVGQFVVSMIATDSTGTKSAAVTATISATEVAPAVSISGASLIGYAGTAISFGSIVTDVSPIATAAGYTYSWTVTKNGAAFASGNSSSITFTPDAAATFVVTLSATDKNNGTGTSQQSIVVLDPTSNTNPSGNLILLPPSELALLQAEALANNPQWTAFKAQLDRYLPVAIQGGYQASGTMWIADYALGYQVLKNIDPTTADNYADKAIAVLKSALNDYQVNNATVFQFLAVGDGSTTSYTLPNSNIIPSSLGVSLGAVQTVAVVHGALNGQDVIPYYATILGVSNTPTGPSNYTQGTDWKHNGNFDNDLIDWSTAAKQPAVGATYYVTYTSSTGAQSTAVKLTGNTITFTTAPTAGQAIFVQYVYGTHSANGSTLAYQQTSGGGGGFNSILIDNDYTDRYLGQYVSIGLNWLSGYVGFSSALQSQTISTLTAWYNYIQSNGYHFNLPASNYGAGEYLSEVVTALALQNQVSNGTQMVAQMLAYRNNILLPAIETGPLSGGYYPDGWNYGTLGIQNILLGSTALAESGLINDAPEQLWADQVITTLLSNQPSPSTIYDGGDSYSYPSPFPAASVGIDLMAVLSATASDPADRSYANYVLQNYANQNAHDYLDVLFRDPSAPASYWSSLPLANLASGTGLLTVRSDWGSNPTWLAVSMGNLSLGSDHQTSNAGQVQIQRGADDLLVNASAVGGYHGGWQKAQYNNSIIVNAPYPVQTYPYAEGLWYGNPGVVINDYESTSNFTYLFGNYAAAYSTHGAPGAGGPVSTLTRQVVYLNPDLVVVFDNVTTLQPSYLKEQQWSFLNAPQMNGNAFVETVGSSKLFGQTFSTVPLTATVTPTVVGSATVQELDFNNASPTSSVQYVTAFQVAPSSTTQMVSTQQILSTDTRMQGVQMGNQVVMFGRTGNVDLTTPVTYQITGNGPVTELLTNLTPGQSYQVRANGTLVTTLTADSAGTISFTTNPSGSQTIQVIL
jgi:hypothetical protein